MDQVSHEKHGLEREVSWQGLLIAINELGYAQHWANDPVVEDYIRKATQRIRDHVSSDILAVAAKPQMVTT